MSCSGCARCGLLLLISVAWAEQPPMVVMSAKDGLPAATPTRILADSKGFVWLPSSEGLTQYNGNSFRTFTRAQGLPADSVSDIIERSGGGYWVASREHVCVFDPRPGSDRFRCESPGLGEILAILEDNGELWCGTDRGLWKRTAGGAWTPASNGKMGAPTLSSPAHRLIRDGRGDVWAATHSGLYRFRSAGRVDRWTTENGLCDDTITMVKETPGAIWAGTQSLLFQFQVDADSGKATIARSYGPADGLPSGYTTDVISWRGSTWAATFQGLARMLPSGRWRSVDLDHSVRNLTLNTLAIDTQGDLWIGADGGGAARLTASGFTRFTQSDGLPIPRVWSILEDRDGELLVITKDERHYSVNRFDGSRFRSHQLSNPFGSMFGWSWSQIAVQSKAGPWWLATSNGLLRYDDSLQSAPSRAGPEAGLPAGNVARVWEDGSGALWVSVYEPGGTALYRRAPTGRTFMRFGEADGLPPMHNAGNPLSCFAEDRHGQIWLGFLRGGLLRFRNGRFEQFTGRAPGAPERGVRALLVDRQDRLWIGTMGQGLLRVDELRKESPSFRPQKLSNGASETEIHALVDDARGRIYAAGAGAVYRLDPEREEGTTVRRFTTADGLISGALRVAFRDRSGALWFGGDQGLCRIVPHEDPRLESAVLIHSIRVNGESRPLSDLGEAAPASLALNDFERQLQVEFGGFRSDLQYQTMLVGLDPDWSSPSPDRSVHYVSLGPGNYELRIRSLSPDGSIGSKQARLEFSIAAPMWSQGWFLALATAILIGIGYWVHVLTLERRLAIERVRSRIATDLHDDIGASLSRIALMSEALQTRAETTDSESRRTLSQIAEESREMVENMSDIVWSIDPRRDTMGDVVARLRAFGSGVLEPLGIRWNFDAPEDLLRRRLSPDERWQLYLMLKEAIHNVARHSQATNARVWIGVEEGSLFAEIEDDGCGYVPNNGRLGVYSMRNRARQLGGAFLVAPRPEGGTRVSFRFPLSAKNA